MTRISYLVSSSKQPKTRVVSHFTDEATVAPRYELPKFSHLAGVGPCFYQGPWLSQSPLSNPPDGHRTRDPGVGRAGEALRPVRSSQLCVSTLLNNWGARVLLHRMSVVKQRLSKPSRGLPEALGQVHILSVATTPCLPCPCLPDRRHSHRHTAALGDLLQALWRITGHAAPSAKNSVLLLQPPHSPGESCLPIEYGPHHHFLREVFPGHETKKDRSASHL